MKKELKKLAFLLLLLFTMTAVSAQFVHKLGGDLLPWTKAPDLEGDNLRFVVIGDLTGGEEPGVFAASIEKINQLAPDFVISVGDLIEGYTTDQASIDSYWESFGKNIAKLDAPFFYVAGNHDMSNKVLYDNWMNRFGYDYYTFTAGGALIMVLSTFEPGGNELPEPQLKYMLKALEDHDPAYPVYVFSHAPLWYRFTEPGYTELMPVLNRYNTTFFCGHIETYLTRVINGKQYFQLAKTGGGIGEENLNMGDFNHILYCTSSKDGLKVANILTDGIISPYIVNDSTMKKVGILRSQRWLTIVPSFDINEAPPVINSEIRLVNNGDWPLVIEGTLPVYDRLKIEPGVISVTVNPGSAKTIPLTMENPGSLKVNELPEINIELTATYRQKGKTITHPASKRWFIDNLHYCRPANAGKELFDCSQPAQVEESWCWSGPGDGNFSFFTESDRKNITIHIETSDDALITFPGVTEKPQDRLLFCFSADTAAAKAAPVYIDLTAGSSREIKVPGRGNGGKITVKCSSEGTSLVADIVIPRSLVTNDIFRVNAGFADLDDHINTDPSVLWWRPKWGSPGDFRLSGLFRLEGR